MMEFISKIKELINSTKTYVELKLKEIKIELVEKVSATVADVTAGMALLFFGLVFILFISIWAALLLNATFNSPHLGFLIIALFWLFAGLIIFALRKPIIKKPISNWITEKVMKNETGRD